MKTSYHGNSLAGFIIISPNDASATSTEFELALEAILYLVGNISEQSPLKVSEKYPRHLLKVIRNIQTK